MESLNDLVERYLGWYDRTLKNKGIKLYTNFDPNMPLIYPDLLEAGNSTRPIYDMLTHLSIDVEDAKPARAFYQTKYSGKKQKLIISHDGMRVPEYTLKELNIKFQLIAEGKERHEEWRHGNLIAAQAIQKIGGRIYIENLDEGKYAVSTIVEIPVLD